MLASPFSDADLGLFGKARSFGYDQVEVCVEDPTRLTAAAVAKAAIVKEIARAVSQWRPVAPSILGPSS